METALVAARLLLAAVFAVAGAGKLLDRPGARQALLDFRVPQWLARPGAVGLPLAELATAAALLVTATARWGAVAAAALMLAFVVGIAGALARDEAPDCHCFGQLHSAPAGRATLVRNALLAAVAGLVAAQGPGPSPAAWLGTRSAPQLAVAGVVAAAVVAWLLLGGGRTVEPGPQEQAPAPSGMPLGSLAPAFHLPGACGNGGVSLHDLRARGRPVLVLFAQTRCGPCQELFPHVARWQAALADRLTIAVVSQGELDANRPLCREHEIADVGVEPAFELFDAYRMPGTPAAVVVDGGGRIASATAVGEAMIEALIRVALRSDALPSPWKQPTPAG